MQVTCSLQTGTGLLSVLGMAWHAHRRASLTPGGIVAALCVGTIHALHPFRILLLLLAFFLCGTKLTHWGDDIKSERIARASSTDGGGKAAAAALHTGRTATQVLCNAGPATLFAALHLWLRSSSSSNHDGAAAAYFACSSSLQDLLMVGIMAQYACAAADTFSSEIGILNDDWPLLITTLRKVPPGTNGGVTLLGLMAALMGSAMIACTACLVVPSRTWATKVALFLLLSVSGVCGSLLDSLLGATCQRTVYNQEMRKVVEVHGGKAVSDDATTQINDTTRYIVLGWDVLDNNQVNLVSGIATSLCAMALVVMANFILDIGR